MSLGLRTLLLPLLFALGGWSCAQMEGYFKKDSGEDSPTTGEPAVTPAVTGAPESPSPSSSPDSSPSPAPDSTVSPTPVPTTGAQEPGSASKSLGTGRALHVVSRISGQSLIALGSVTAGSVDGGQSWVASSLPGEPRSIAESAGTLFVLGSDIATGEPFCAKSIDGGMSWTKVSTIDSRFAAGDEISSMVVSGGVIYVAYASLESGSPNFGKVTFAKSADGCASFPAGSKREIVSESSSMYPSFNTSMFLFGGKLYLLSYSIMSDTLELSESSDNGDTWATHEIVEMSGSEQRRPVAVSNGSTVFVVNESGKVYRSSDATTWTKVADLGYMVGPSMVVYGSKIAISYYTFSNTHRLAVSEDGGVTWTSTLVDGAAFGWKAGLSNEGNNLLLAYANSDYSVLKVLKSPDFGKSFSW